MNQSNRKTDEMEIDLLELFMELLVHWKLLITSAIIVAAIALLYTKFLVTPMYSSTAEFFVLSKSTSITSVADLQLGTNLTNDYMVVVKGRPVIEQVIRDLNLEGETYKTLSPRVSLNNPQNSRILMITVEDADPARAKAIADEIAVVSAEYIAEKMDQDPPSIIQYGYTDGNPVNIHTGRNTLMGAMVGGVLAAALVVIMYLLNDTVMSNEDIERKLGLNVLGTIPYSESFDDEIGADGKRKKKRKSKKKKKSEKSDKGE